jgi:hypothetical protein
MNPINLDDILANFETWRGKPLPLGELIETRHKLTANIEFNLYCGGSKEEGRKALSVRNSLDELIFKARPSDLIDGKSDGLDHLKRAITVENLAERLQILEEVSKNAKGSAKKLKEELINVLVDRDRFERFFPEQQSNIKAAAIGSSFLAFRRLNKIMDSLRQQALEYFPIM